MRNYRILLFMVLIWISYACFAQTNYVPTNPGFIGVQTSMDVTCDQITGVWKGFMVSSSGDYGNPGEKWPITLSLNNHDGNVFGRFDSSTIKFFGMMTGDLWGKCRDGMLTNVIAPSRYQPPCGTPAPQSGLVNPNLLFVYFISEGTMGSSTFLAILTRESSRYPYPLINKQIQPQPNIPDCHA